MWTVTLLVVASVLVPSGTELELRLLKKVGSAVSRAGDPVEAIVVAPVIVSGNVVVPAGAKLRGTVKAARASAGAAERAGLAVEFTEVELGERTKAPVSCRLTRIDNAREQVDGAGAILGILASESLSSRMDQGIQSVSRRLEGLGAILDSAKKALLRETDPEIAYEPGVELTVALTADLESPFPVRPIESFDIDAVASEVELTRLVQTLPFRTIAENPPKPSDLTTLMFLGARAQIEHAFAAAGWASAASLDRKAKIETFRAIAEDRGYREAPMSVLLLDGQKPDLQFQKQNNTFAMRHHLRIWRRPEAFQGREVWLCAATHDVGIDFSPENRTFIHKIDPQIDRERAKVVSDLLFAGVVSALSLVDRPEVPRESSNATGDQLLTDARLAVVQLK